MTTPEEAEQSRFCGSPTILVDSSDTFARGNEPFGPLRRMFQTPDGPAGSPTIQQIKAATAVNSDRATRHQMSDTSSVQLRITGTDLPGRHCGNGSTNVHVGIQIRRDPEQVVPADVTTVTFTTEIELVCRDGTVDFKGPAVQGRPEADSSTSPGATPATMVTSACSVEPSSCSMLSTPR